MSVNVKPLVTAAYAAATETTVYTAPAGTRTIIDKITVFNTDSSAPITYTVKLCPVGSTAADSHLMAEKTLAPRESYTFPELIGQALETGGFVSAIASTGSKLVRRMTGREITN